MVALRLQCFGMPTGLFVIILLLRTKKSVTVGYEEFCKYPKMVISIVFDKFNVSVNQSVNFLNHSVSGNQADFLTKKC